MSFNLSAILNFKAPGVKDELDKVNQSFSNLKTSGQRVTQGTNQVAGGMKAVGLAGAGLAAGVSYSVNEHIAFEKQMSSVIAKMDDGRENFSNLELVAKQLGASTVYSATEAAAGLDFLATAGYSAKEAIGVLPTVLKTAAASNMGLAQTTSIVADSLANLSPVMGVYGDKTQQAIVLSDMLAMAGAKTNSEVSDLGEAITYGGGALANLGIPLEEIIGSLGLLANAGIKGSSAGTSMVNMFAKLQDPTENAHKWLAAMGLKYKDFINQDTGKLLRMDKIIGMVGKQAETLGDSFDIGAALAEIFGLRGQKAFFAMNNTLKIAPDLFDSLRNSLGESDKMYKIMTDNLWGMTQNFQSASEGVRLELGKMVAEQGGLLQMGTSVIDPIQNLANAFMALNIPVEQYATLEKQMGKEKFGEIFKILTTDVGQFAVGVRDGFLSAKKGIGEFATSIWNAMGLTSGATEGYKQLGEKIGKFATWLAVIGPVVLGVGAAFMFIAPIITSVVGIVNLLVGAFTLVTSVISLVVGGLTVLKTAFIGSAIQIQLATWWTNAFNTSTIRSTASTLLSTAATRIASMWTAIFGVSTARTTALTILSSAATVIATTAQGAYNVVMLVGLNVMNLLKWAVLGAASAIRAVTVATGLSTIATRVAAVVTSAWTATIKAATLATKLVTVATRVAAITTAAWNAVVAFGSVVMAVIRTRIIATIMATWLSVAASKAATIAQVVWSAATAIGTGILAAFRSGTLLVRAAQLAGIAVMGMMTGAQWLFNAALNANPIGLVVLGIAALVGAGYLLYKNWDTITAGLQKAWIWFKNLGTSISDLWSKMNVGENLMYALSNPMSILKAGVAALGTGWDYVITKISAAWDWIKRIMSSGMDKVAGWFGFGDTEMTMTQTQTTQTAGQQQPSWLSGPEGTFSEKPKEKGIWDKMKGWVGLGDAQPTQPTTQPTQKGKQPTQTPQTVVAEAGKPTTQQPATTQKGKFKGSLPNLPNQYIPKEERKKGKGTGTGGGNKDLEEENRMLDQMLNRLMMPTVSEDQPIVSNIVNQTNPQAMPSKDGTITVPSITPPPSIVKPEGGKKPTAEAQAARNYGSEMAMKTGGGPQILVNIPAPQVQLGDIVVDLKVAQSADGTYSLVKKAIRHEANKAGTQLDLTAQEGISQSGHKAAN